MIISSSYKHCEILLEECAEFAKVWKLEFNSSKSTAFTMFKSRVSFEPKFELNGSPIPNVSGFVYLGLPIGSQDYINEFVENKWKAVEKSFFSLHGLGCKMKNMSPYLVSFLYKTFCQSIFRYVLEGVLISVTKLDELNTRQNLLIKQTIGVNKYSKMKALNEAINLDSITKLYCKHKIFFLKHLRKNSMCAEIFDHLNKKYEKFDRSNTSFCNQLGNLSGSLLIDCSVFKYKTSLDVIDLKFSCNNQGLVDSVKFLLSRISALMENNSNFFIYMMNSANNFVIMCFFI